MGQVSSVNVLTLYVFHAHHYFLDKYHLPPKDLYKGHLPLIKHNVELNIYPHIFIGNLELLTS